MESFCETSYITKKSNEGTATDCLTYNNIRRNGLSDIGQFRTMKERFGWRVRKSVCLGGPPSRSAEQYDGRLVNLVEWMCVGNRDYALRLLMRGDDLLCYSGFRDMDYDPLKQHIKKYWGKELQKKKLATRGWHWGTKKIHEKSFIFRVDNHDAFEIPRERINQTSFTRGGICVSLENDERRADAEDQLLELRFFLPSNKNVTEENMDSLYKTFTSLPLSKSKASSELICIFPDVKVMVPAGRFDIHIMRTMLVLHGKSNDFKIPYDTINQMYLLHGAPSLHVNLLLQLASPLRKGHTPYCNAVLRFDDKKDITLQLEGTKEEFTAMQSSVQNSDFPRPFESTMTGKEENLISQLLVTLVGKELIVSETFKSASGSPCFRCSYKAESGHFYPLEDYFVFIHKPVIIIKYQDVSSISIGRTVGAQTKLFEFDIAMHNGPTHSFSSVDRQESNTFLDFLVKKNITVRSAQPDLKLYGKQDTLSDHDSDAENDDEDDEEDENDEEESVESSLESSSSYEETDERLKSTERPRVSRKRKTEKGAALKKRDKSVKSSG